ncbi:MAG: hypothetical protein M0R73_13765 [Dehalococcoidia bacterium]|nr:hypothetical protein [Dehalococcoidia bacterium]
MRTLLEARRAGFDTTAAPANPDKVTQQSRVAREGSVVKHVTTNNSQQAVQVAVDLAANPGLSRTSPLERHLRDVMRARAYASGRRGAHQPRQGGAGVRRRAPLTGHRAGDPSAGRRRERGTRPWSL